MATYTPEQMAAKLEALALRAVITVEPLNVNANGTYTAPAGTAYSPVTVAVPGTPLNPLTVSANGTYTPAAGYGYSTVTVAVPEIQTETLSVAANGVYTAQEGTAYSSVEVNVETAGLKILVTAPPGSTVTASRDGSSYSGTESTTSPGNYLIQVPEYGTYVVTAVRGEDSAEKTVAVQPATSELSYTSSIYGVNWDGTSNSKMVRTDDAAWLTDPIPYIAGATQYGSPFDNIYPWSDMVKEERPEGTMVKIPKFWYKLEQAGNGGVSIRICGEAVDGFSVCPACMDRGDGRGERDYVYVGRYHCAASTYKSTTGVLPQVSQTKATFRTQCAALGSFVWMMDFATRFTIWLLYAVEFADWNSQNCIGYGCAPTGSTSAVRTMGYTDSMPYHTGTDQTERTSYGGTQYRYIEGLWDNCYDFLGSCYYNANGLNIIINPASDNENRTGGVLVGLPVGGWIAGWAISNSGPFPMFINSSTSGGSGTSYVCDSWSVSSSIASYPILFAGGDYLYQGQDKGLFYVSFYATSSTGRGTSSRLIEIP